MSELLVLDRTGDTRLQWDPTNHDEVTAAKKKFNEFRKKGYAGFKVNSKGGQGEQLDAFDPMEERIMLIPPMVGG